MSAARKRRRRWNTRANDHAAGDLPFPNLTHPLLPYTRVSYHLRRAAGAAGLRGSDNECGSEKRSQKVEARRGGEWEEAMGNRVDASTLSPKVPLHFYIGTDPSAQDQRIPVTGFALGCLLPIVTYCDAPGRERARSVIVKSTSNKCTGGQLKWRAEMENTRVSTPDPESGLATQLHRGSSNGSVLEQCIDQVEMRIEINRSRRGEEASGKKRWAIESIPQP
ncbi:hypothetical protein BKA62DRAFT_754173 [Auriculariales sp. MPI-PUGE-AT-0066]|nr:hypothetical protein BKA62DRAFT_754173 [Auriculariales sp. MPI-PUGE-AT-0066]